MCNIGDTCSCITYYTNKSAHHAMALYCTITFVRLNRVSVLTETILHMMVIYNAVGLKIVKTFETRNTVAIS